ncbi:MAG: hypothetical protein EOO74_04875 [Myxococcales bacterium]|nr:MAG: hypothetical protein EOO74_04875 [Myxococcales bacterium]
MKALTQLVALRDEAMTRVVPLLAEPTWIEVTTFGYDRTQEQRKFWAREGKTPLFRLVFGDAVGSDEIDALVDDDGQPLLRSRSRTLWQPIRRVAR